MLHSHHETSFSRKSIVIETRGHFLGILVIWTLYVSLLSTGRTLMLRNTLMPVFAGTALILTASIGALQAEAKLEIMLLFELGGWYGSFSESSLSNP